MSGVDLLERHRPEIEALCRRYGVRRLRVFGSGVRPDWDPDRSDIDLAAEFGDPPQGVDLFMQQFGLLVRLEELLGPVDLVDWSAAKSEAFRASASRSMVDWYESGD